MSAFSIPQDFSNDRGDLSSDDSLGEFWPNFCIQIFPNYIINLVK